MIISEVLHGTTERNIGVLTRNTAENIRRYECSETAGLYNSTETFIRDCSISVPFERRCKTFQDKYGQKLTGQISIRDHNKRVNNWVP